MHSIGCIYRYRTEMIHSHLTNGCTGQISAVTFCAKNMHKSRHQNLLGEPGVMFSGR